MRQVLAEVFLSYQSRSPDELAALMRRRYRHASMGSLCGMVAGRSF